MRYNDLFQYTKDLNILYIEDEADLRKEIEDILLCLFKNTVSAIDGEDGFNKYIEYTKDDKNYFDIVLTDINMPKLNGIELIKKINQINHNQTVIVMSAYNESEKLIALINLGITNFIHKPFSRQQFSDIFIKAGQSIIFEKEKIQLAIDKELYEYKKIILEDKSNSLKELLNNIAHHWRQPLSVISTIAGGLQIDQDIGEYDHKKQYELLEKIIDTTQDISATIDNFSKIIEPKQHKSFFNIKDTSQSVTYFLSSKIKNKNIIIIEDIQDIEVHQSQYQIQQVLAHILNNAIDSMEANDTKLLFINISKQNNNIDIKIKDNGTGIDPSIINKICEPYFTTKYKSKGTGLGLFVVNEFITKEMQGTLEFKNVDYSYNGTNYSGTLVQIILPIETPKV